MCVPGNDGRGVEGTGGQQSTVSAWVQWKSPFTMAAGGFDAIHVHGVTDPSA